jgi:hypothetical protein
MTTVTWSPHWHYHIPVIPEGADFEDYPDGYMECPNPWVDNCTPDSAYDDFADPGLIFTEWCHHADIGVL